MNISKIKLTNNVVANIKDATARAAIASFNATFAQKVHRHEYTDIINAPWTNDAKANTAYNKACDAYNASNVVSNMAQNHAGNTSIHVNSALQDKWNNYASYINAATNIAQNACNIANNACNIANASKEWTDILNKPESFNPSVHGHDWTEIINKPEFSDPEWNNISNKPSVFPPEYHTHSISEVTQLQFKLNIMNNTMNNIANNVSSDWNNITNKPNTFPSEWNNVSNKPDKFTPEDHLHTIANVISLQTTLNSMNNAINNAGTGNVDWDNISNKPSEYPPEFHTHLFTDVYSGGSLNIPLNRTLDGFANIISNKANASHTHTKSQITDFPAIPTVDWNQIQTSGNKIAEVTINGISTDVYAPEGGGGGNPEWTEILNKPSKFPTNWALVEDHPTIPRKNRHTIYVGSCTVTRVDEYGTSPASTSYKCVKVVTPTMDIQEGDLITLVWDSDTGATSTYRNIYLQFGSSDTAKHWILTYKSENNSTNYNLIGSAKTSSILCTNTFVYSEKLYSYGVLTWQNYYFDNDNYIAYCSTAAATQTKAITMKYVWSGDDEVGILVPVVIQYANTYSGTIKTTFAGRTYIVYLDGVISSATNKTIPRGLVWMYFKKVEDENICYIGLNGDIAEEYFETHFTGGSEVTWNQIQRTGTKIAELSIDGEDIDVYAPSGSSSVEWNNISNKPSTFTPSAHNQDWSTITNKPTIPVVPSTWEWNNVSNKPSTYPPSSHSHNYSEISNKPTIPTVSWEQTQTTGVAIANVTINGATTTVYAPESGGRDCNLFIAIYGTTTISEISQAIEAGKEVVCWNSSDGCFANLISHSAYSYAYFFTFNRSNTTIKVYSCTTTWLVSNTYTFLTDEHYTAYCSTSQGTQTKSVTFRWNKAATGGYAGQLIPIMFQYANTYAGAISLNINSRNYTVYIDGTISSSTNNTIPMGLVWVYISATTTRAYINSTGIIPDEYYDEQVISHIPIYDGGIT